MANLIDSTDYRVIDDVVGEGGGGCFRAGTQIQLEHGKTISIERLKIGDQILAFDEWGDIHVAKVTKLHIHEDPQLILKVQFWRGEAYITPNHWVLNQYSSFVEMGNLTTNDALIDGMGHLRPITSIEKFGNEPVYNLTVEPHHTFIANDIRVHNGGHRERYPVVGSGGGGDSKGSGGGSRAAIEDPDTLESRANVKVIDLLGEGKIGGLINGAKSIYLNGTQLMSESGVYNFSNVTWSQRDGSPNQPVVPDFSTVETPISSGNVEITYAASQTFSITNLNSDRVRVIVNIPALTMQDMTTGDLHGNSVSYHFEISKDGGAFNQIGSNVTINGKTKSNYQRSHVLTLPKPATTGWTIKVVRDSADDNSATASNKTRLDGYVGIVDAKLNYANSALVSIGIDPETFSSVPSRTYLVNGLYIRVPSNYNATTRGYTGIWDGSFILATSNNPAWILFDLLTSKRYGLGKYLTDAQVDKAMLYTIGRYCDEMVPDGLGGSGTEPRFTINTVIQTQSEAYRLIGDITSAFRGMAFWAGGMVSFRQDSPASPTMTFNQANVVNGEFNYTGSSRKDRHSVVNVTWNDPEALYKQRVEYVEDQELIATIGIRKVNTVAFGCTSRGQANRVGKWILYSERYEANAITFKVGLDSSLLLPGEIVRICDAFRAGKRMGGRAVVATTTSLTADAPVTLTSGAVTIFIAMPDGSFAQRTIAQTNGSFTTFTWTTALPATPLNNAVFVLSDQIVPMLARVISVAQNEKEPNEFTVTAIEHNPTKFAAIDTGVLLRQPQTSVALPYVVTITNVAIEESTYFIAPGVIGSKLHVSWEGKAQRFRISYRITINGSIGNWKTVETKIASFDLEGLREFSIIDFKISGMNPMGEWTVPVLASKTIAGKSSPPGKVTGLTATAMIRSVLLKWVNPPDIDFDYVEIFMSLTNDSSTATLIATSRDDTYTVVGLPPSASTRYFWLKAVDTSGNRSDFNTVSGVSATTLIEADYMVALLESKVTSSMLNTELGARINLVDGPVGNVGTVAYQVNQEAIARANALTAEATARGTAITNERTLWQAGDTSLAQSISTLTASSATGFDSGVMWYFDATVEGWTSLGATQAWSNGNVNVTSTGADPQFNSPSGLTIVGSQYSVVKMRVKRLAGSGWDGLLFYKTAGHPTFSASYYKSIPAPSPFAVGDTAIIDFDMSALTVGGTDWVSSTITQIRIDLGSTSADVFAVDWVAIGRNGPAASTAALSTEQNARVQGDQSVAGTVTTLSAQVNHATTGLPQTRAELIASYDVRDTADSANATATLNLSNQVNHVTTGLPATKAALTSEINARTTLTDAHTSSINTLTTTVGGHTTTIATQTTSINGIQGKYTVKIDNNGYVSGYGLISNANNGAVVSDFAIRADKFWISNPSGPGASSPVSPFMVLSTPLTIDGTTFPVGVYMNNAIITKLNATQIDTRGLTIKDALGNVIFASGTPLDYNTYISNRPASVSEINAQEGLLMASMAADFTESFDGMNVTLNWQNLAGAGEVSVVTSTTSTFGGKVLTIGNSVGNDQAWLVHQRLIPFDASRQYRIRCRLRRVSGSGANCYVGFVGVAADGATFVNTGGANSAVSAQHYHCVAAANPNSLFAEFVGYTKGFGATVGDTAAGTLTAPSKMHPNVRYLRPMILVNNGAVAGKYEIDSLIVESIAGGSATWAELSDKPTDLAGINTGEGTKLTGIQDGATVGADNSNLQSGKGVNGLHNAGFYLGLEGWNAADWALDYAGYNIAESGGQQGTAWIAQTAPDGVYKYLYPNAGFRMPATAGSKYEASVYVGAHRCNVNVYIEYLNAAGVNLGVGAIVSSDDTNVWGDAIGGTELSLYKRIWVFSTSPAGTASARIVIRKSPTGAAQTSSYAFVCQPYLGRSHSGQVSLSPWSEGASGQTVKISPTNVSTYIANVAIDTAQIALAAIDSAQIANAAITSAKIGVAAIDTLSLGGNVVTVPTSAYTAGATGFIGAVNVEVQSLVVPAQTVSYKLLIDFGFSWTQNGAGGNGGSINCVLTSNGASVYAAPWATGQWGYGSSSASMILSVAANTIITLRLYANVSTWATVTAVNRLITAVACKR